MVCRRCGETEATVQFRPNRRTCRSCESVQRGHRRHMQFFGATPESLAALAEAQGNACAICRVPFDNTQVVDHNHVTGKVRGLLCNACNLGLGQFRDSSKLLVFAREYLEGRLTIQKRTHRLVEQINSSKQGEQK